MNIKELQSIAEDIGGVVLVEDGKPKFIILSYEKFTELNNRKRKTPKVKQKENDPQTDLGLNHTNIDKDNFKTEKVKSESLVENLNKEISALREGIETKEKDLDLSLNQ